MICLECGMSGFPETSAYPGKWRPQFVAATDIIVVIPKFPILLVSLEQRKIILLGFITFSGYKCSRFSLFTKNFTEMNDLQNKNSS